MKLEELNLLELDSTELMEINGGEDGDAARLLGYMIGWNVGVIRWGLRQLVC